MVEAGGGDWGSFCGRLKSLACFLLAEMKSRVLNLLPTNWFLQTEIDEF